MFPEQEVKDDMTGTYSIRQAFLHISHELLKAYFQHISAPLEVEWNAIDGSDVEPLLTAWRSLPEKTQIQSQHDLQDVWFLGDEHGVRALSSVADDIHRPFLQEVGQIESPMDRALWVRIHREPVWNRAQGFLPIDQLTSKRLWRRYRDLITRSIKAPDTKATALAEAIGGFFLEHDGQGQRHAADHTLKTSTGENYFAVYVDAGIEPNPEINDQNVVQKDFRRRTVTIAFVYSQAAGTVRVYTERDAKVARSLFERFHHAMWGEAAPPDDTRQTAYRLSRVLAEDFQPLAPDPTKVRSIAITQLRVRPKSNMHRQIILRGDVRNCGTKDTFTMLDDLLHPVRLPRHAIEVDQMSVRAELQPGRADGKKVLSFDVTWPNGGNLHNQPEALQPLGEAILEHWGIDTKPKEAIDAWADFLRIVDTGTATIGQETLDGWPNGLAQLLLAEGVVSLTTPANAALCDFCHESHEVTFEEQEEHTVCKMFCPTISRNIQIDVQRVQRYEIHPAKLMPRVAQSLWVKTAPTEIVPNSVWRMGTSTSRLIDRPLYFALNAGKDAIGVEGYPFNRDAIVVVPHQIWQTDLLTPFNIQFVRLQQVLTYSEEGLISDLDALFEELSIPREDRLGMAKPWTFTAPSTLVAFGDVFTLSDLTQQTTNMLRIASGRMSIPLTELFQTNGTAVWKEKLRHGVGTEEQRRKVSTALSRLNKRLLNAHAPITFELPARSEEIVIIS